MSMHQFINLFSGMPALLPSVHVAFCPQRKYCFIFCCVQISTCFLEKSWKKYSYSFCCFIPTHFLFSTTIILSFIRSIMYSSVTVFFLFARIFSVHHIFSCLWMTKNSTDSVILAIQLLFSEFKHKAWITFCLATKGWDTTTTPVLLESQLTTCLC